MDDAVEQVYGLCAPDADLPVKASGAVSSSKLARTIGVSPRYLLQIGARLREAGFVRVGCMAQPAAISCHGRRLKSV